MKNKEHFNDLPLHAAMAKYEEDLKSGLDYDWSAWLEVPFVDPSKGKVVRGKFYTFDETEEKIRDMESKPVTGYLLEFKGEGDANYKPSEFATGYDTNYYFDMYDRQPESEEWYKGEVVDGFFAALPDVRLDDGSDWEYRLGVAFYARREPTETPTAEGMWEGDCTGWTFGEQHTKWRVRRVTIDGTMSDKARAYFRKFPNIYMNHEWE